MMWEPTPELRWLRTRSYGDLVLQQKWQGFHWGPDMSVLKPAYEPANAVKHYQGGAEEWRKVPEVYE